MNFKDEADSLQVLSSLIQHVATKSDHKSALEERILQAKMRAPLPSLFELIHLLDNQQPIDSNMAAELRVELCEAIESRLQEVYKLLLSPEERQMATNDDLDQLIRSRLRMLDGELTELDTLDERERDLVNEMRPNLTEFLNVFEFLLIDHGLKFRIEHDKKAIEGMVLKAQSLLVQCRYRDTKKAFEKYGNKETVNELRRKREQLEGKNKALKLRLKEANEKRQKLTKLDPKLRQELLELSTELERKKWALSIGTKEIN
jgi:hypothetical protein